MYIWVNQSNLSSLPICKSRSYTLGARGDRCGGLLSFLLPPSRRLALTAGRADGVGGQFPVAADHAAISPDYDVLAGHQEEEQAPGIVKSWTAAPVGTVPLAAGQLVPLDTDDLGADSELLERGGHEVERTGAVDRRSRWGGRRRGQFGRRCLALLDRVRRLGRSWLSLGEGDPAEDEDQEQDQRNADPERPGFHRPEHPVVIGFGQGEGIISGHRVPRGW